MSTRDKDFIKKLGIKQKELAEALSVKPHSVSAGLKDSNDYLDLRKMNVLREYLSKRSDFDAEDFENEKITYYGKVDEVNLQDAIAKAAQVWIIGDDANELKYYDKALSFFSNLSENTIKSVAFCISPRFPHKGLFNMLRLLYEQNNTPEILPYILESAFVIPGVTLFLVDQHSSNSSSFLLLEDDQTGKPLEDLVEYYRSLFFRNGLGVSEMSFSSNFLLDNTPNDLKIIYTPEMISGIRKVN